MDPGAAGLEDCPSHPDSRSATLTTAATRFTPPRGAQPSSQTPWCALTNILRSSWACPISYISSYVSIYDVGTVAFVGSVPIVSPLTGVREQRGNVYIREEDGLQNVTVGTNNNLEPFSPFTYNYGPVQINNDNAIVAALDRTATRLSPTPAESSVTVWWPTDGVGPYVPAEVTSALARDWRFSGVSISNGGGSDALRKPGLGRVAFAAQRVSDKLTFLATNATPSGLFASDFAVRAIHQGDHPSFPIPLFPMIADSGRVAVNRGTSCQCSMSSPWTCCLLGSLQCPALPTRSDCMASPMRITS